MMLLAVIPSPMANGFHFYQGHEKDNLLLAIIQRHLVLYKADHLARS